MSNRKDVFFGKLAVKAGYITEKQLSEVFKVQKALALKAKPDSAKVNIGAIMAAKGLLTRAQVLKIRSHQKKIDANRISMMCLSCGAKYKIKNYRPGRKIACQKCGEKLRLSSMSETQPESETQSETQSETRNKTAESAEPSSDTSSATPAVEKSEIKSTDTIDKVRNILAGMDNKAVDAKPPEQEAVASVKEMPEQPSAASGEVASEPEKGAETESDTTDDTHDEETSAAVENRSGEVASEPEKAAETESDTTNDTHDEETSGVAEYTEDLAKLDSAIEDTQDLLAAMDDEDSSLNVTIKIDRSDAAALRKKNKINIRPLNVILDDKKNTSLDDFSIMHSIGKGGMAEVFAARQASVDRLIALKMIKTDKKIDDESRYKFISEAVVTGDLDHPNIVPVHDLGLSQEGVLFYSMKHVKGVEWERVLPDKSLADNLDILLSVCDAMAFAHDKGIVHRDLKPLNIMLGDYGEVLVMDWGLAISFDEKGKADRLSGKMGMAGTPAFMAPEMAKCDSRRIDTRSDIYLLGGILYKIVTGLRPHESDSVVACVHEAMQNKIQPTDKKGELTDIALKAMATVPEERYHTVKDFQVAIREYQAHAESIALSNSALEDIQNAETHSDYDRFANGLYRCREALEMWPENETAGTGLARGTLSYAQCAFEKDDFDLAASLLTPENDAHRDLAERVEKARRRREYRKKRLKLLSFGISGLAILIIVILGIAFFWIKGEKERAVIAEKEARIAQKQESVQRQKAEQENYFNIVTIAIQKISDSLIGQAKELLMTPSAKLREWEWGRLMYLCNLERATLKGHTDTITAAVFSPDGNLAATGSGDNTVKIWDKASGELRTTLTGHSAAIKAVAFSDDSKRLTTSDTDGVTKNWNIETGAETDLNIKLPDAMRSVAFSADGTLKLMTRLDRENSAIISEIATGKELMNLKGHTGKVLAVTFAPDGKRVATGSADKTAKIWDVKTGRIIMTLTGHTQTVGTVSFSPDGEEIITGSNDKTARVWGTQSGTDVKLQDVDSVYVSSIAFSPDSRRIVSGSRSVSTPTAIIWDATDGKVLLKLNGHTHYIYSVAFSPDGKTVLTGSRDKTAILWNAADGLKLHTLKGHTGAVYAVAYSPDGSRLYTGSWDKSVRVWDTQTGKHLKTLQGHTGGVLAIGISPDGHHIVTSAGINGRKTAKEAASKKQTVIIWDAQSGQKLQTLPGHDDSVYDVSYSSDGKKIVTASWDGSVKIWNAVNGKVLKTLRGHSRSIQTAAFSPDSRRLATGSRDRTTKIWDIDTGRELLTLQDHSAQVTYVVFSPDGRKLASASRDDTVVIWNTYNQK
jgi:WD40 repeat protein/serine/threonine protein kinase/DNA-directed RNA polymerase subunit RPC12/RpoP